MATTTAVKRRRGATLPVVCTAQLLVVLDGTIVNIALPSAQAELGMTDADRHWVITAYLLAFGGLLLLGGRISGVLGHRRALLLGLGGFALAAVLGGSAVEPWQLYAARAAQGACAALLAPAGLALLSITHTEPAERGRAFGVFAAVGATGAAVGLLAGGVLTQTVGWRWCLHVNAPIAIAAILAALWIPRDRATPARLDWPGAILSVTGISAVVYGLSRAEAHGWRDTTTLAPLLGGLALLAGFALLQVRGRHPLLPPRLLRHRTRAVALLVIAGVHAAVFGYFLFFSYHTQTVLDYSPIAAGAVMLGNALAAVLGSTVIAARALGRVSPAAVAIPGLLALVAGTLVTVWIPARTTGVLLPYLLPSLLLTGLGLGVVIAATAAAATAEVPVADAGTASAAYNTAMQLGAAVGIPLFNTLAVSATDTDAITAVVSGYRTGLVAAAAILLGCLAVALLAIREPSTHNRKA